MARLQPETDSKTILMVDDEPDVLSVLEPLLAAEGYRVETARDGEEALRRIQERRPDLVLLDLQMPGMGGRAVCDVLRHQPSTRWLPIIVLTGRAAPAEEIGCLEHGADDFVAKPFDSRELTARIQALIRRCELGRWRPSSIPSPN
ncbi:MAG: response regulator [Elusimicrobia bacterium]|nr:response regulator [Elusimicrobiota bacterium]